MTDGERRRVGIFSEEFSANVVKSAMNVRKDVEGLVWYLVVLISGLTFIVGFWWIAGRKSITIYAQTWMQTYPGVPLTESFWINLFLLADVATQAFLAFAWLFVAVIVVVLAISEREARRQDTRRNPPVARLGRPRSIATCPNCSSTKTRPAGKGRHPGERYCKTCRTFY